jgi:hypothetical protein
VLTPIACVLFFVRCIAANTQHFWLFATFACHRLFGIHGIADTRLILLLCFPG